MPEKIRPLYSTLADDPAVSESIDAFVVGLAERVDDLQDADACGDFEKLAALADSLAGDSKRVGYDALCRSAEAVRAASADQSAQTVRKALIELTEVSRRVRMGHRGAV